LELNYGIKIPINIVEEAVQFLLYDKYPFIEEQPVTQTWEFYDTFDWRLFNQSLVLQYTSNQVNLRKLSSGELLDTITFTHVPKFVWGFPNSLLRKRLNTIIDVRALLLLSKVSVTSRVYRILNGEEKTVARVIITTVLSVDKSNTQQTAFISLQPVRGYPKYARKLALDLSELGEKSSMMEEIYRDSLINNHLVPAFYSSKLNISLDPNTPAAEAITLVLKRLLAIMAANESGIKADVDTEFLHDFRIATRKTRSILSQLSDIFPLDIATKFKKDFAEQGKVSNKLRDLDVYLLSESKYRTLLPVYMQHDIDPLFDYLSEQRKEALTKVTNYLNSEQYKSLKREWKAFLETPIEEYTDAPAATEPILQLAKRKIYKQYRRIIKDGNYILDHTDDELLHALRIECKKLRYLIEFFSSLFPGEDIECVLQQLKKLQDNLGKFNDLAIQQEHLLDLIETIPIKNGDSKMALVATGYIIQNMEQQQKQVKEKFAKTFRKFSSDRNSNLYRKLFMPEGTATNK